MADEILPEKKKRGRKTRPPPEEKKCGKCLLVKPQSDFNICRAKTVDGRPTAHLSWACIECRNRQHRERYAKETGKPPEYFDAEFRVAVKTHRPDPSPKRETLDKLLDGVEWAASRMPKEKRCCDCGEVKDRSEFSAYVYRTDNHKRSVRLQQRCKPCDKKFRSRKLVRDRVNKSAMRLRKYRRSLIEEPDKHLSEHPAAYSDRTPPEKTCCICRIQKLWSEFLYRREAPDGLSKECRACILKASMYRFKYGMELAEFEIIAEEQGWVCAICKATPDVNRGFFGFCVDHDHKTGSVRGLLCSCCNTALGFLREDVSIMENLIIYTKERCDGKFSRYESAARGHRKEKRVNQVSATKPQSD